MVETTDRDKKKIEIELTGLQELIASDMERMAGQLKNKYIPKWDSETFDPKLNKERVKWLKRFNTKMKTANREFFNLFFKRDMRR